MKSITLINSLVSNVRSIFVLQFQVFKTFKQFENDKQLVEVNLSYNGCMLLFVNGKRIPKMRRILVTPIDGKKVVTFRAIGFFQIKNVILEVEPKVVLDTNLSKQLSSNTNSCFSNKKLLNPLYPNSLINKINPELKVKNLVPRGFRSRTLNKKISQIKSKSRHYILKSNSTTITEIITNQ
jgi:hypothetical protein